MISAPQGTLVPWGAVPYSKWRGVGKEEVSGGGRGGGGDGNGNPPLPPFACRKVAGGSHGRPRTGTRPRGKGTAPPTGAAAPVSGRPPPGRHRVKELSPPGPPLSCRTYFYKVSSHSCSETGQKYFSQKAGFEKTSIWSSYRSKCSISGFPGRGKMAPLMSRSFLGSVLTKTKNQDFARKRGP